MKVDDFHALIADGLKPEYRADIDEIGKLAAKLKPLAGQDLTGNPVWQEFIVRYWRFYRRYFADVGDYNAYLWRSRIFAGYIQQVALFRVSIREVHFPALGLPVIIGPIRIPILFIDTVVNHVSSSCLSSNLE